MRKEATQIERDARLATSSAVALFNLSVQLQRELEKPEALRDDAECAGKIAACATNLSLAAELSLKALWVSANKTPPSRHDLGELFRDMPPEIKAACVARYQAYPLPKGHNIAWVVDSFNAASPPARMTARQPRRSPT